jgi:hypothetical protein
MPFLRLIPILTLLLLPSCAAIGLLAPEGKKKPQPIPHHLEVTWNRPGLQQQAFTLLQKPVTNDLQNGND